MPSLKTLSYKQVFVPIASPKPDLVALTGGYRRAPVMQIGADIFCDSHLILRSLEDLHPEPTLFPNGSEGEATVLAWWAERYIFMPALGFIAYINGDDLYAPDFVEERRKFGYVLDKEELKPLNPRNVQQLVAHLAWLRNLLADGRPYLLGDQVSAAALAAYPSLWFLRKWGGGRLSGSCLSNPCSAGSSAWRPWATAVPQRSPPRPRWTSRANRRPLPQMSWQMAIPRVLKRERR